MHVRILVHHLGRTYIHSSAHTSGRGPSERSESAWHRARIGTAIGSVHGSFGSAGRAGPFFLLRDQDRIQLGPGTANECSCSPPGLQASRLGSSPLGNLKLETLDMASRRGGWLAGCRWWPCGWTTGPCRAAYRIQPCGPRAWRGSRRTFVKRGRVPHLQCASQSHSHALPTRISSHVTAIS